VRRGEPTPSANRDRTQHSKIRAYSITSSASAGGRPAAYRPRTTPGVYVPTAITISSMWPDMKPFVMAKGSQFRPKPIAFHLALLG
jgi:hypothetical protein